MIKSLLRPVAFTLCLTVFIFWLSYKSRQTGHARYDEFSRLLSMIGHLDAEINAEVMKLEFRLHRSYDRLTQLEKNYSQCNLELDHFTTMAFENAASRELLTAPMYRKLELITNFKALHAVLENSVAIFYRSSEKLSNCLAQDSNLPRASSDLLRLQKAGMELVVSGSQRSCEDLRKCIEQVNRWELNADSPAQRSRKVMLAHAQNLLKAKPQMAQLLLELNQLSVAESLQTMQARATSVYESASKQAAGYHLQLLFATLLMIVYCGYSIYSIGRYVNTIRLANEQLEERVRARTTALEAKSEQLRSTGRFLATVLDAMDAKICILDAHGAIDATNAVWNAFANEPTWIGAGRNYLSAFADGERTVFGSPEVVQAIESMQFSTETTNIVEYATSSPERIQWVQARVNKMPSGPDKFLGYVVALIDITQRVKAEEDKDKLHRQLQTLSRQAGMAEVATGVLHNVGNVLNSINIASSQATRIVRSSRLASLHKAEQLLLEHERDFATFVSEDPRGQHLPRYISEIAKTWDEEQTQLLCELDELTRHIEHVKHVINVQQEHAKLSTVKQAVQLSLLIDDAITTIAPALKISKIELVRQMASIPLIQSDPHKIMQILINLLSNAKHAVQDSKASEPRIVVRCHTSGDRIVLSVIDNGIGIAPEIFARICQHGFTTKKNGHGFGLHSCALLAQDLGGELEFSSPGVGLGATFSLVLPTCQP